MAKRGQKTKDKIKIEWSANFAYAIGLIATDGGLSRDGRHVSFTSKDIEQIENMKYCLSINPKAGHTVSGYNKNKTSRIQFSDSFFHSWLCGIGIVPNKSKIIAEIKVPDDYFFDFLRGCFDGDGSIHSYWDKRWKSSFMFYLSFVSASEKHILWLQSEIFKRTKLAGHITSNKVKTVFQLKYAKKDSIVVIHRMYHSKSVTHLIRKKLKIDGILAIVGESL